MGNLQRKSELDNVVYLDTPLNKSLIGPRNVCKICRLTHKTPVRVFWGIAILDVKLEFLDELSKIYPIDSKNEQIFYDSDNGCFCTKSNILLRVILQATRMNNLEVVLKQIIF